MADNNLYRPMRILTAFWQVMQKAADKVQADIILVDIGPNLGAINRSVLLATDFVAIPTRGRLVFVARFEQFGTHAEKLERSLEKRLDNWADSPESAGFPDFRMPEAG